MTDIMEDATPYYNVALERSFITSVLYHGRTAFDMCKGIIGVGDFFVPKHGYIFEAMETMTGDIDFVLLSDRLAQMGRLKDVGGDVALANFLDGHFVGLSDTPLLAQSVKGYSIARTMARALQASLTTLSRGDDVNVYEHLHNTVSALQKIEAPSSSKTTQQVMRDYINQRELEFEDPNKRDGLSWGIPAMDSAIGLLKRKQFVVIAGAAGAGKSLVLATVMSRWINSGVRVGLLSLEMSNFEVLDRLTEIQSGINPEIVIENQDGIGWSKLMKTWANLYQTPLHLSDEVIKIDGVLSKMMEWQREAGGDMPRVIVVDYAGLVMPADEYKRAQAYEKLEHITRTLKQLAMKYDVSILSAWQLNRDGYTTTPPTLKELGGSLSAGKDADKVIGVYRPSADDLSLVNMNVMKRRSGGGAGGVIKMRQEGLTLKILTDRIEP